MDEEMGDHAHGNDVSHGVGKRACDQCRVRKLRCDRETPCSTCRTAQRVCSSEGPDHKPKESKQRVLISAKYERKIDQIADGIASIDRLLRTGGRLTDSPQLVHRHGSTNSSNGCDPVVLDEAGMRNGIPENDDADSVSVFEGDSSLAAHTSFASQFLDHVVERDQLQTAHPNIEPALTALRQMASMRDPQLKLSSHEPRFPYQKPLPSRGLREMPMPPIQHVVGLLRDAKENPPSTFRLSVPFLTVAEFSEYCRCVYFAVQDFSPCLFIVVNTGLYYLFLEQLDEGDDQARMDEYRGYLEMCRENLETGLANLSMFLLPKKENIEALLLGANWAVEHAKPTLAWQMTAAACHLCLALGYHRASTYKTPTGDVRDPRPCLFWNIYILDKGISLNLGRASVLSDYDITLPRDVLDGLTIGPEWRAILNMGIEAAVIQGDIYEKLYSPEALLRLERDRVATAWALAETLKALIEKNRYAQLEYTGQKDGALLEMVLKSDQVSMFSSLTLIYRALPPPRGSAGTFGPDCIDTARGAMRIHHACIDAVRDSDYFSSAYIHWVILYAPFIPFIVIFCHIVETSNATNDLPLLSAFVNSLERVRGASRASEKLYRLCQVLCDVAKLYVEAKRQQVQAAAAQEQAQAVVFPGLGDEVDMYLSALGLVPADLGGEPPAQVVAPVGGQLTNHPGPVEGAAFPTSSGSYLGEWFSGNQHMMGLLEEDMTNWGGA